MTVKARTWLLLAILLVVGGGAVVFAGLHILSVVHALNARAPIIALDAIDGTALMAGAGLLCLAALYIVPTPYVGPGRPKKAGPAGKRLDLGPAVILVAGVCMILSPFAPSVLRALVATTAEGRGYVACPHLNWPRRQPDRWALPTPPGAQARCPREGSAPT